MSSSLELTLIKDFNQITFGSIQITCDNNHLFIGDNSGKIKRLSLNTTNNIQNIDQIYSEPISCLSCFQDSTGIIIADQDGGLIIYKTNNGSITNEFSLCASFSKVITWNGKIAIPENPAMSNFYVTDGDGDMFIFNKNEGMLDEKLDLRDKHPNTIDSIICSHDSETLFIGDRSGYLKEYVIYEDIALDFQTPKCDFGQIFGEEVFVTCLAINKNDEFIFASSDSAKIVKCSIDTGKVVKTIGPIFDDRGEIQSIVCSYDFLIAGNSYNDQFGDKGGELKQYCLQTLDLIKDYGKIMKNAIESMCITPNLKTLFISDNNGHLSMYNLPNDSKIWDECIEANDKRVQSNKEYKECYRIDMIKRNKFRQHISIMSIHTPFDSESNLDRK